jgi:hypothetical protein
MDAGGERVKEAQIANTPEAFASYFRGVDVVNLHLNHEKKSSVRRLSNRNGVFSFRVDGRHNGVRTRHHHGSSAPRHPGATNKA